MTRTIAIVGANLAGGRAAETLRAEGFDGRVVLVGDELEPPYERPPLSKGFLLGNVAEDEFALHPPSWYDEQAIELHLGVRANGLDPETQSVQLESGESIHYDQCLIATGARPRRLPVPGDDLAGGHYLRTVADARLIRAQLQSATRVAVVGMGFIGAEVAASARGAGKEVVALEMAELPMLAALGREVAERLAVVHRDHGVDVRLGERVVAFEGDGRLERIVTGSGATIDCDLAVVGIGVSPAVEWLAGSGIEIGRGVIVDERCRTNLPGVFAAGDVAEWWHPTYGERLLVEHFDNAGNQGTHAAKSMLRATDPYAPLPYFWSDQYDLSIQFAGINTGYDRVVFRGSEADQSWSACYLRDGRFVAIISINRFKDFSAGRRLLRAGTSVTADQLADEGIELKSLLT